MLVSASVAMAMTAPGQTPAISVFVDPLSTSLHVSRSSVAMAYSIGSLAGVLVMPLLGRLLDRHGPRRGMVAVALCFGAVLVAAGTVTGFVGLSTAFVGIRIGGQGALSLVATTVVAVYVQRHRGLAMGVVSAIGTSAISLAPLALERLIGGLGWRAVWQLEGWAVLVLAVPAALFVLPRRVLADGGARTTEADAGSAASAREPPAGWTLRDASRTAVFWVVVSGAGVCSLITTALTFHQVSLLGERGLGLAEAAANFVPQLFAGLLASFLVGWLADHIGDRTLIIAVMAVLALTTLTAGWVRPGWPAVAYGLALGASTAGVRTLRAVVFSDCFGQGHLGTLRGVVHSVIIGTSALGPVVLALGRAWSDSYRDALVALCALPVLVVVAACLTRPPRSDVDSPAEQISRRRREPRRRPPG
ncbi:MFS transporter [Amycolatopsis jiangsuensis]|uniref:MFS family permease n=1 Tax=Amycolatopsis jiangsuensis TaxID=1181879 RepID=A0A840IPQ6_9PSEU|nr:MFS transporter [Amycolatopsis jiangsuensis]MBB4683172.1 MFS family permease [Amycolatopsis jiangsuensis]